MAFAKSMSIVVLPAICCLAGCRPFDDPFWDYRMGQLYRYRAEIERQYAADVAAHAAKESHLGTWVKIDRRHTKKLDSLTKTHAVALFRDGAYVHKTLRGRGLRGTVGTVVTGEWQKTGPGKIRLTVTGKWREEPRGKAKLVPPPTAETQTIDLKDWTNLFVEADAALMGEADVDAGVRPSDASAE